MDTFIGRGLHRSTVETLGLRIVSGEVGEGETLDVVELQRDFDVSLTVIREALRVLASKGLVAARQKRGTFVRPRSEWQLLDGDVLRWQFGSTPSARFFQDLEELRGIVEPPSARLAAERRTPEDLETLQRHLTAMSDAVGDPSAEVEADLAFHQALLLATHNELLARLDVLIRNGLEARDRLVHDAGPHPDPVPAHRAVLDKVAAGDADGAERAMRALIARSVEDLARLRPGAAPPRQSRRRSAASSTAAGTAAPRKVSRTAKTGQTTKPAAKTTKATKTTKTARTVAKTAKTVASATPVKAATGGRRAAPATGRSRSTARSRS